jgi:hypothetical protein
MLYIMTYLVVSFVITVFLWAGLAIAKRHDDEKEKHLTDIMLNLASNRATNRN